MKDYDEKNEIFEELVTAYYSLTMVTFKARSRNYPNIDVEELNHKFWVDHVYPKALKVMDKIRSLSPGYIVTMAKNYMTDQLRESQKTGSRPLELKEDNASIATEESIEDKIIEEDKNEECRRQINDILHLLRRSEINQAVFRFMLDGLSNGQIAKQLGISKESVEQRKFKIRGIIRDYYRSQER